ncbi:MAG: sodium/solute symporter [Desulfuromonadaceae bacterium]|nr:sodium/solute symporter [Desulfuromonadaceae bacterium]
MKNLFLCMTIVLMFGTSVLAVEPAGTAPKAPAPAIGASGAQPSAAQQAPAGTVTAAGPAAAVKAAAPAPAVPTKLKTNRVLTIGMFLAIICVTLGIVVWASRTTKSAADFYTAGGGITGFQNGWAIAGDYLSAATFLGITGLISIAGMDGFMYAVGPLVTFVTILLVIAEPCRNAGKYTMGDILSFRSSPKVVRGFAAVSTVAVSVFYLLAQMVGAGKLMQVLLDIPFRASVIGVGVLIVVYVVFGGMKATTWVQIIKAGLLMSCGVFMSVMILVKVGMNPIRFFAEIASSVPIQDHVRMLLKHPLAEPGFDYGQRFLEPGLFLKNPIDQISLGIAWLLGAAGLPHIMMRFFTVPDAKSARKSVIVAMFLIGFFFIMTTILGFGASIYLTPQTLMSVDKGGNMSALLLAQYLGGGAGSVTGDLFLAFVCAVAFTTILAVVSGLVLASSAAISHDIYVNIIKDGHAEQHDQVRVARITSLVVGIVAIILGIAAEKENIVHLVALAFAVAASGNFPVILLSLFWKRFNTAGIVSGLTVGAVTAIGLVMVSPNMTYPKKIAADAKKIVTTLEKKQAEGVVLAEKDLKMLEKSRADYEKNKDGTSMLGLDAPLFPLKNPGIVSVPFGFLAAIFGCLLFRERRAEEMFNEVYVRQNTGLGIAKASDH